MIFTKSINLMHVDLSHNHLVYVNDYFIDTLNYDYRQLKSIDLSHNDLKDIPLGLLRSAVPWTIDLSGNKLSFASILTVCQKVASTVNVDESDPYAMSSFLSGIKSIDLYNNAFTGFDISPMDEVLRDALVFFFLFIRLNFGKFVFHCDCSMYYLHQFIAGYDSVFTNIDSTDIDLDIVNTFDHNMNSFNCLYPKEVRGKSLIQIPISKLGCHEELASYPKHCKCWVRTIDEAVMVNCANRNLTRIPDSLPNRSIELDFSNNHLVDLQEEFLDNGLQVLDLSGNGLQNMNKNIFTSRYNFSDLRLHNNDLTTLPKTVSSIEDIGSHSLCDKPFYHQIAWIFEDIVFKDKNDARQGVSSI